MSSEKQFCENYFVLKPENASFYDLASFLFSSKSETSKFIEYSEEFEGGFWIRWYIFTSLFAQKLLLKVGKPLVLIGNVLELWLNLLSSNGGLLRLITNFFTGLVCVNLSMFCFICSMIFIKFHIYNPHACMAVYMGKIAMQ